MRTEICPIDVDARRGRRPIRVAMLDPRRPQRSALVRYPPALGHLTP
jgi:hypothetical protein